MLPFAILVDFFLLQLKLRLQRLVSEIGSTLAVGGILDSQYLKGNETGTTITLQLFRIGQSY